MLLPINTDTLVSGLLRAYKMIRECDGQGHKLAKVLPYVRLLYQQAKASNNSLIESVTDAMLADLHAVINMIPLDKRYGMVNITLVTAYVGKVCYYKNDKRPDKVIPCIITDLESGMIFIKCDTETYKVSVNELYEYSYS